MKTIRFGNDIPIEWSINRNNQPEDFTGKTLRLTMIGTSGTTEVTDYTVEGNVLRWMFWGKDQHTPSTYHFCLVENGGEEGMFTIDTCDVLRLVSHSCAADDCDGPFTMQITSNIDGKAVTDSLKDITYLAADGTRKPLYPAAFYCSQFFGGEGFLPSAAQFYELMKDVTYGLSGVTRDKADPVNRSLYAIGGSGLGVTSTWWLCLRLSAASAYFASNSGNVDVTSFCYSLRCAPLSLLTLPEAAD